MEREPSKKPVIDLELAKPAGDVLHGPLAPTGDALSHWRDQQGYQPARNSRRGNQRSCRPSSFSGGGSSPARVAEKFIIAIVKLQGKGLP
jgi:hypothetical protein